eukprot:UN02282
MTSHLDFGPLKIDFLEGILLRRKVWVCSVVESWLKDGKKPKLSPCYEWFGHGRSDRQGGGTGLIVHRNLNGKDVTESLVGSLHVEATFVSCNIFGQTFLFGSVYLPGRVNSEISQFLKVLENIADSDYDHKLFGGDWNASHVAWGCDHSLDTTNTGRRGRKLFAGFERLNF